MSITYNVFVEREYDTALRRLWLDGGIRPHDWTHDGILESAGSQGGSWVVSREDWLFRGIAGHDVRARTEFSMTFQSTSTILEGCKELLSFVDRLLGATTDTVMMSQLYDHIFLLRASDDLVLNIGDSFWEGSRERWATSHRHRRALLTFPEGPWHAP
ncbi:MAG: hypothetical protein KTR31_12850 [Myxococcales bacterium]|nr:hypothetical protein [Myxococcales bacterium]